VVRATKVAGLSIALTMTWAGTVEIQAMPPFGMAGLSSTLGQAASAWRASAHAALSRGIESYQQGDYETAATAFAQAQAARRDLSPGEQQELDTMVQRNTAALQAQRAGDAQLHQAEQAIHLGRRQEAEALLRHVATNQFLTDVDKDLFQQLTAELRRPGGAMPASPPDFGPSPGEVARTKLRQARAMMREGNYDAAEALAREAKQIGVFYQPREDTPARVLDAIAQVRSDPHALLAVGRAAYRRGDYDLAELLARQADHAAGTFTFVLRSDSPSKLLADIKLRRSQPARAVVPVDEGPMRPAVPVIAAPPSSFTGGNRTTLVPAPTTSGVTASSSPYGAARTDNGDSVPAAPHSGPTVSSYGMRSATAPAEAMVPAVPPPAPAMVNTLPVPTPASATVPGTSASGIIQAGGPEPMATPAEARPAPAGAPTPGRTGAECESPCDAPGTVDAGQPCPDNCAEGAMTAPAANPRVMLQLGRALYDRGKYDEAEKLALQAQADTSVRWNGLFKDTPNKLLRDIHAARARGPHDGSAEVLAQARQLFEMGRYDEARQQAQVAAQLHGTYFFWQSGDTPQKLLAEIDAAQQKNKAGTTAGGPPAQPPVGPARQRAQQLLAEADQLRQYNDLVGARQKAIEAQKVGAFFRPDEESPEQALNQLTALAGQRIEHLLQMASQQPTAGNPAALHQVHDTLAQARQLALGFAFDCQPIDARIAALHDAEQPTRPPETPGELAATGGPVLPVPVVTSIANAARQQGDRLLDQAKQQLRSGHTDKARELAEQAYQGEYGVRDDAAGLLRMIGSEDVRQRSKVADRAFDSGFNLYLHKDYQEALKVFQTVDFSLLPPGKQARLRELMQTPEMQPHESVQVADGGGDGSILQASAHATASDVPGQGHVITPEESFAQQTAAMLQVEFQMLRDEALKAQSHATDLARNRDMDGALEVLQNFLGDLQKSRLSSEQVHLLRGPVDFRIEQFKVLKAELDKENQLNAPRENWRQLHDARLRAQAHKQQQVTELMREYKELYDQGKYRDAEVKCMMAHDLDPDNVAASAACHLVRNQIGITEARTARHNREDQFLHQLNQAEDEGRYVNIDHPLDIDPEYYNERVRNRKAVPEGIELKQPKTEKILDIERRLTSLTNMDFKDVPLGQALRDLSVKHLINIVPDVSALRDANISIDQPMTMQLDGVQLKSALKLLLNQAHLTYVLQDEVLLVTTESKASGNLVRRVYPVPDIIIPVEDNADNGVKKLLTAVQGDVPAPHSPVSPGGRSPLGGGSEVSSYGNSMNPAPNGQWAVNSLPNMPTRSPGQTLQDTLMELITNTIKPDSWSKLGGQGTIDYFPLGMALVVNQTPDIQEQIADLLQALRRLQDLEVTIEVRFVTLAEAFYERIGLDFSMNITNRQTKYEPQLITGNFAPPNQLNVFRPTDFWSGLFAVPSGSPTTGAAFTSDLGFPIHPGSFGPAVPPFGGFANAPPDGGLQLGLAFLSDIQVYMLLEAAQADQRTNVMQAPKLTLFNGQTATITIGDLTWYVININVEQDLGQIVFLPQNVPLTPNTQNLVVQAVVSGDRRFVRLNLVPTIVNQSVQTTTLFPITTFITPVFEGGAQGQPIPFTQYLQQPRFTAITATTTVSVPDGGTVLIGGLKTLREGRKEFGPPILSKLPYINRLFKNTAYGKETESFLMMVTPRIIINEEEEELAIAGRAPLLQGGIMPAGPGGAIGGLNPNAPPPPVEGVPRAGQ
jgi:Flp pilus assembly secretin CpaC